MNIVGISAFYHESAACLLREGTLTAAAAEERFTRVKHDARLPVRAYRYCLDAGGLGPGDVDAVAFYESPEKKLDRQRWSGLTPRADDAARPERMIREYLGFEGPVLYFDHHLSHAASAFLFSGFNDAAVLTVDGVGEWATTTYGRGRGASIEVFEEVRFPHSLGLFYATVTAYLGFKVNDGEYKVMGLAPYGVPRFVDQMRRIVRSGDDGGYELDMEFFDVVGGDSMYADRFCALFGAPPRRAGEPLDAVHADIARSAQVVLEDILLDKVRYLATRVDSPNLCLAGGVALNCVANGRIVREGPFERLFVPPAPGDAGACLGAAALAHIELTGTRHTNETMTRVDFGPAYAPEDHAALLHDAGIDFADNKGRDRDLVEAVAERLERGQVIGWFQGGMEFGPRALGHRSIVADPRDPAMRDRINAKVKRRELFRPFAPSVLAARAGAHFDLDHPSPFMLETCAVRSSLPLPAITHVDGSARPESVDPSTNPRYAAVLEAFERRTGCPVLLNTSLNVAGEPIACTPVDALMCLAAADLSALVLGDIIVDRSALPENWQTLLAAWDTAARPAFAAARGPIAEQLYTFV